MSTFLAHYPTDPARCWHEDSHDENGNYENKCIRCRQPFVGHKDRSTCKVCANEWDAKWAAMAEEERVAHREKQALKAAQGMADHFSAIPVSPETLRSLGFFQPPGKTDQWLHMGLDLSYTNCLPTGQQLLAGICRAAREQGREEGRGEIWECLP